MRKAKLLAPSVATFVLLFAGTSAPAETNYGQVAMHVAYMLQNHHYSHQEFDDEVSKKLLDGYLDFLDFSHIYFTQEDVDKFKSDYATSLDEHILTRNISPALDIYYKYESRVKQRVEYAKKAIEQKKFSFDSQRTVEMKRDKVPWPKDEAAADVLWNDLIEADLLGERLSDKARDDAKKKKAESKAAEAKGKPEENAKPELPVDGKGTAAKSAPSKGKAHSVSDPEEAPEVRVMKRYERLLEQLAENEQEDIVNYFLSCLAGSYDPHTEYMSQQETDNFRIAMNHSLVGIGALLSSKDNLAEIQGIVVGGPADKQGELKLGDKILAVGQGEGNGSAGDWVDIKYMKLQKIVEMIRGNAGTLVRLKVNPAAADDPSEIRIIHIVRGPVELKEKLANAELFQTPPVDGKSSKLGWINLSSFYADMEEGTVSCTTDVQKLLKRLMAEKIEGLVVDLRGDGGGSLEEAIKLTGLFVPKGPVVQAKDWKDNITWRDCENERPMYEGPLVVLTDRASASASEIFAAALQDYRRAVIVGEKATFGKGTVQTILAVERFMPFFSDKSRAGSLKVTIQKFYRIAGGSTQLRGVTPDIQLPSVRDILEIGEDSLPHALPYDTIPPRTFTYATKSATPINEVRARVQTRISANPEFQYVVEDTKRLKERIDKNRISLNEKERQAELDENKARSEARKAERKVRVKELADKAQEGFQQFRLTMDNVEKPELVKNSTFTKEQATGMRMAANDDDDDGNGEDSQFPYGIEPVKLETLNILRDLVEFTARHPQTANASEGKSAGL
ncbi:MAG: carboxy terminal-processing peptidase [Roseimicrobium sp.]